MGTRAHQPQPFAAFVNYTVDRDLYKTEKPYELYNVEGQPNGTLTNVIYESIDVGNVLEDIRGREGDFTLDRDSFCYMTHRTAVNLYSEDLKVIYPYAHEVNDLLQEIFKTIHVFCYDVRFRFNRELSDEEVMSTSRRTPAPVVSGVHCDHTPSGGWARIQRHLSSEEYAHFANGQWRARIINVWRPVQGPAVDCPLGLLHPGSVQEGDRLSSDHASKFGAVEVFQFKFNQAHRWYYLKDQKVDEIAVFVAFDSHPPNGKINYAPHAAMTLPFVAPGTPPRQSVETRTIVFTKL
jgi:hypothetical protein